MAQESPRRGFKADELDAFSQALQSAHNDLWWRQFIKLIKERRQDFLEQLATQRQDMRTEDTIRGQITELALFISLDEVAARELTRRKPDGAESAPSIERIPS